MFPMARYEEPELAGFVEIWACSRRSSFQRRPSRRSLVRGYVVEVSRGMMTGFLDQNCSNELTGPNDSPHHAMGICDGLKNLLSEDTRFGICVSGEISQTNSKERPFSRMILQLLGLWYRATVA